MPGCHDLPRVRRDLEWNFVRRLWFPMRGLDYVHAVVAQ